MQEKRLEIAEALALVDLAEKIDGRDRAENPASTEEFERRADELPQVVDVLLAAGEDAAALRLVGSISHFCQNAGLVDLGVDLARRTLSRARDAGTDADRARAWLTLGELAFRQGEQSLANTATEHALTAAQASSDRHLEHRAEYNLARIAFRDGDADEIGVHARRMEELAGDEARLRFGATHMLGWAAYTAGDIEEAMALFERNVETAAEAGNTVGRAAELLNLGSLSLGIGDLDAARAYLGRGLDIAEELDSSYLIPGALTDVGRLAVLGGRLASGLQLIAAGERQYREAGLIPDPGDDAFQEQRAEAVAGLGEDRAATLAAEGGSLNRREAIALARRELTETA